MGHLYESIREGGLVYILFGFILFQINSKIGKLILKFFTFSQVNATSGLTRLKRSVIRSPSVFLIAWLRPSPIEMTSKFFLNTYLERYINLNILILIIVKIIAIYHMKWKKFKEYFTSYRQISI